MEVTRVETVDNPAAVKRRKLSSSLPFVQLKTIDCKIYVNSVPDQLKPSLESSRVPASCCSSTDSPENLKVLDLEESVEIGSVVTRGYDSDGGEKSLSKSEFKAESGELESTIGKHSLVIKNPCKHAMLSQEKMPHESELEEFFAAAQEGLNKRFKDKYNFDIVDDIPMKGRFEWIQVMPRK